MMLFLALLLMLTNEAESYGIYADNDATADSTGECCASYEPSPFGANITSQTCVVGPPCTMGVHNNFSEYECACPGADQPPDLTNLSDFRDHFYADQFVMDFKVYFFNSTELVPQIPGEDVKQYITYGRTFYDINVGGGFMRESYFERCLPIFPEPPLFTHDAYSCDFYTLNDNNTAFLVLHDDKPSGAPDCCIIGNPFRAPPQDFFQKLTTKYQTREPFADGVEPGMEQDDETELIDWRRTLVPGMGGNVIYGFLNGANVSDVPFAFVFTGLPQIAEWCYQRFYDFEYTKPATDASVLPSACLESDVTYCPGWEPWRASSCANESCGEGDDDADSVHEKKVILSVVMCLAFALRALQ